MREARYWDRDTIKMKLAATQRSMLHNRLRFKCNPVPFAASNEHFTQGNFEGDLFRLTFALSNTPSNLKP